MIIIRIIAWKRAKHNTEHFKLLNIFGEGFKLDFFSKFLIDGYMYNI